VLELRSGDQPAKAGAEISDRVSASTPVFMRNMIFLSSYVIIIIDNNRNPPVGKTQNCHRSYGDIGLEQETTGDLWKINIETTMHLRDIFRRRT
jgi:hypothetical protein